MALGFHFPSFDSSVPLLEFLWISYRFLCQTGLFLLQSVCLQRRCAFRLSSFSPWSSYLISLLTEDQKHPCHFPPGKNGFWCTPYSQKPDAVLVIGVFCIHTSFLQQFLDQQKIHDMVYWRCHVREELVITDTFCIGRIKQRYFCKRYLEIWLWVTQKARC